MATAGNTGGDRPVAPSSTLPDQLRDAIASSPLIGRRPALDVFVECLCASAAEDDGGRFVLIAGEHGVGKTRLMAEVAKLAVKLGFQVFYGRCQAQPLAPYEPFIEALRGPAAEGRLAALSPERRAWLARMLPELEAPADSTDRLALEFERLGVFDAVSRALAAASSERPAVLMLEDLQFAEASSLQLLGYLCDGLARRPLVIVGTVRDPDAASSDELNRIVDRSRSAVVRLGGLDDAAVSELLSTWTDRTSPEPLAEELSVQTGGNPLLLRQLLETIEEKAEDRGELPATLPADALTRVPRDIIAAERQRVDALGPYAAALLKAGALMGREFVVDEAAQAAHLSLDQAVTAADAAVAAGLVTAVEGARPALRFRRELGRQALREAIGPTEQALLHLRIAQAIETKPSLSARLPEVAQHFHQARGVGGGARALRYARKAAEAANSRLAFKDAVAHLELAVRAIESLGGLDWRQHYDVLMELGLAQHRVSGPGAAAGSFSEAARLALDQGDEARAATATLEAGLERYLRPPVGVDLLRIERLEQARSSIGSADSVLRARLGIAIAYERTLLDPLEQRVAAAEDALAEARSSADPAALLEALVVEQTSTCCPGRSEHLTERLVEALDLAADLRRPDLIGCLHRWAVAMSCELNRVAEVDRHAAAVAASEAIREPAHRVHSRAVAMTLRLVRGQLRAREELEGMVSELEPEDAHLLADDWLAWSFALERESDRLETLRPALEDAVNAAPELIYRRAMLAEAYGRLGDLDASRAELEAIDRHGLERASEQPLGLATLSMSATAAVLCADEARAERLHELLAPWAGRNAVLGFAAVDRPVHHILGLLAGLLRRPEDALAHFEAAERSSLDWGALPWLGHALCKRGITLRRLGRRDEARHVLRRALDISGQFPGEALRRRARKELVALGVRPRRERLKGPAALTPAELRVVQLAARGKANNEIAQLLTLSHRTVETHLTSSYRKLGIRCRAELAEALEAEKA